LLARLSAGAARRAEDAEAGGMVGKGLEQRSGSAGLVAAADDRAELEVQLHRRIDLLDFAEAAQGLDILAQIGQRHGEVSFMI
jgi:hypothetical protein